MYPFFLLFLMVCKVSVIISKHETVTFFTKRKTLATVGCVSNPVSNYWEQIIRFLCFMIKKTLSPGARGGKKLTAHQEYWEGVGEERELKMSFCWLAFKILFMKWIKFSYCINKQILFFGVFFRFVGQPRDMSWGQSARQNKISVCLRERGKRTYKMC